MLVSNAAGGSINQYSLLKEQFARFSKNFKFIIPSLGLCLRNHSRGVQKQMCKGGNGSAFFSSSVQFSRSVVSDSLRLHELHHARPPCPSPTPGVHSNSCPSSRWCHPAISSSVVPFSLCPHSLPATESFPRSQLFAWGFFFFKEQQKKVSNNLDFYKSQVN